MTTIPLGYCQCGCGERTRIAPQNDPRSGWILGQSIRYLRGHGRIKSHILYLEEDRGHTTPCWIWQRAIGSNGYGFFRIEGVLTTAHKAFYVDKYGPIPEGKELDHLCRVRACCNPDHLEPVSRLVNVRRGAATFLSQEEVESIRHSTRKGVDLAREYHVTPDHISRIKRGRVRL